MEIIIKLLEELLTTALITKKIGYFIAFLIILAGFIGYTFYTN